MNKILKLMIAILFSVLMVTLVSTVWLTLPAFIVNQRVGVQMEHVLLYAYFSVIFSTMIILFIGVPIYLWLEFINKTTIVKLAMIGFIIPVVIILLFNLTLSGGPNISFSSGQNYYGTYREMVINNEFTFLGWVRFFEQLISFGMYGLIGAVTFGKIMTTIK